MARDRVSMRVEYERCRVWGHAWDSFTPHGKRGPAWGTTFFLRCDRCGTERHDVIDHLGDVAQRTYVYPDDYRLSADETPTRQSMRLDVLGALRSNRRRRTA